MDNKSLITPLLIPSTLTPDHLRGARRLAGLTIEEMAKRIEVSRKSIERIETSAEALDRAAFGTIARFLSELLRLGIEVQADGSIVKRSPTE